ncbi:hypothetical protein GCM10027535_21080 [Mycolicibacterium hippocampi]|uniref:Uncharacterized protein n=1 Tax=Mycolicibacterium hippocampi TaxID=659824 RepID=A0A7I9ZHU9_9MYCO|nr:hypothetical protein MHIP_06910 [Mycolicibacterium hippocampi]
MPFDEMRAELDRLLHANPLWDGRVGVLQATDAVEGYVRVRMLVSAPNAGALFDLRCDVREGMVAWLQDANPGALPRRRLEHQSGRDVGLRGRAFDQNEDVVPIRTANWPGCATTAVEHPGTRVSVKRVAVGLPLR